MGNFSSDDNISPRLDPHLLQKQRLYLNPSSGKYSVTHSLPDTHEKASRSTIKNSDVPSLRQRLQWQMPRKLGSLAKVNFTAPQQQLP